MCMWYVYAGSAWIVSYQIAISLDDQSWQTAGYSSSANTSYTVYGLLPATAYAFKVVFCSQ